MEQLIWCDRIFLLNINIYIKLKISYRYRLPYQGDDMRSHSNKKFTILYICINMTFLVFRYYYVLKDKYIITTRDEGGHIVRPIR